MTTRDYARLGRVVELISDIAKRVDELSPIRSMARDELRKLGMTDEFINGIMRELLDSYMPTVTGGRVFNVIINAVREANA